MKIKETRIIYSHKNLKKNYRTIKRVGTFNCFDQWRRLHWVRWARAPPPLLQMAGHGGTVSRKTANKKLTTLYWPSRKRSQKVEGTKKRCVPSFISVPVSLLSRRGMRSPSEILHSLRHTLSLLFTVFLPSIIWCQLVGKNTTTNNNDICIAPWSQRNAEALTSLSGLRCARKWGF